MTTCNHLLDGRARLSSITQTIIIFSPSLEREAMETLLFNSREFPFDSRNTHKENDEKG